MRDDYAPLEGAELLESKICYFKDMMFRCKGYEYQKIETIRKEISDMRIKLQNLPVYKE